MPCGGRAVSRQADQAAADLCRPGRDRGAEHAAVQRDAGVAGTADRHRRDPGVDERIDVRHSTGVRCDRSAACGGCSTRSSRWWRWRATARSRSPRSMARPARRSCSRTTPTPSTTRHTSAARCCAAKCRRSCRCRATRRCPPLTAELAARFGWEAQIAAPMILGGKVIGAIVTARREAVPFDDKQVALITSFADQAVIAIENVRLFNETREALERQTATSEVLQVISESPTSVAAGVRRDRAARPAAVQRDHERRGAVRRQARAHGGLRRRLRAGAREDAEPLPAPGRSPDA